MITIAPAKAGDGALLARLHASAFARPWSAQEMEQMLGAAQAITLTARDTARKAAAHTAAGFVLARCVGGEAEVLSIAVEPQSRRRGVGRKLMESLIETLTDALATDLFLEVDTANAPALALYRGLGFAEAGRRSGYYAGADGPSDALVLRLALAPGRAAGSKTAQKPL